MVLVAEAKIYPCVVKCRSEAYPSIQVRLKTDQFSPEQAGSKIILTVEKPTTRLELVVGSRLGPTGRPATLYAPRTTTLGLTRYVITRLPFQQIDVPLTLGDCANDNERRENGNVNFTCFGGTINVSHSNCDFTMPYNYLTGTLQNLLNYKKNIAR